MNKTAKCLCQSDADFYFNVRGFDIFKCLNCTLVFVWPRVIDFEIYNQDYFSGATHGFGFLNYEYDKSASVGYLKMYIRWLTHLNIPKASKLLDVGAANGFFVNLATENGFLATGIELSEEAVEWAKKLGRKVIQANAMSIPTNDKFDVVTVLDVLEHMSEPTEFLIKIKKNLNTTGLLLINVPNVGSLFARLSGKSWHSYVPPEHLFYFNRKSLSKLLESNGYEIIKMRSIAKTFKFSYIYNTMINSPQVSKKFIKVLNIFKPIMMTKLGEVKIFLPLFDNLTVIAKVVK